MSRLSCVLLGVVGVASFAAGGLAAPAPRALADKKKDKAVEELMEKVHEGKKSPFKQALGAAAKNPPDWNTLAGALPRLEQMSAALKNSKVTDIKDSSDSYVEAVASLAATTKAKDADGARKALESLKQSCEDCHYKGGIGGELEDD